MAHTCSRRLNVITILTMAAMFVPMWTTDAAQGNAIPAAEAAEEGWVETIVPTDALPSDEPVTLGLFRTVWEAGAGYRYQEDTPGMAVECVVAGELAFRPAREIAVVRAGAPSATEPLSADSETVLAPGDCVILGADVHRDERNTGNGPVDFVTVVIIPDNTSPPAGAPEAIEFGPMGYIYAGHWSRDALGPDGPLRLGLHRMTLAPGASLPTQARVGDALIAVTDGTLGLTPIGGVPVVERAVSFTSPMGSRVPEGSETTIATGDSVHIHERTAYTLRNTENGPVSWWLVTVEPVEEGSGTPTA